MAPAAKRRAFVSCAGVGIRACVRGRARSQSGGGAAEQGRDGVRWWTDLVHLVVGDEFDGGVGEDAEEGRGVALEEPAHARVGVDLRAGAEGAAPGPLWTRVSGPERRGDGARGGGWDGMGWGGKRRDAPAYFWKSGLEAWKRILTLSSGATTVLACGGRCTHVSAHRAARERERDARRSPRRRPRSPSERSGRGLSFP